MTHPLEVTVETKVCSICKAEKLLTEFYRRKASRDGLAYNCKECENDRVRKYNEAPGHKERKALMDAKWRAENKDWVVARSAKWYEENKDQAADASLRRLYDISLAEYDEMLEAQGGGCAICGMTPEENGKRLHVDHEHGTGPMKVRDLLCNRCNRVVGSMEDSSELCRRMMLYLKRWGE